MAVMYTHSVFLRFLLIFVLLDVTGGMANSMKGHFRRKDFPDDEKFSNRRAINGSKSRIHRDDKSEMQFDNVNLQVVGQTRTTVSLHCDTRKLKVPGTENVTVIWVKLQNGGHTILTEGKQVLTYDKRLFASNKMDPMDWTLYIRYSRFEDQGLYLCQICAQSNFSNSIQVNLTLTEAWAEIIGSAERNVSKVGSPLRLSCELKDSIEAPKYIYWYHGDRMINFDLNDGATVREGRQGSELIFPRAQEDHAGIYSCVPSNARPASVTVFVNAKTYGTNNNVSAGKKSHPQDLVINMLVMVSIFLVYR